VCLLYMIAFHYICLIIIIPNIVMNKIVLCNLMLFRSYIGSYLNVQRRAKHNGKARNKSTTWWEQRHVNGYMLGCLWEQAKWPTSAPIWLPLEFWIFAKRLYYEKTLILNQAIAVLRQSVGLPGRFVTVWKKPTGHTHTHTTTVTLRRMRTEG